MCSAAGIRRCRGNHRAFYEQRLTEEADELCVTGGSSVDWQIRTGEPGAELVSAAGDTGT